MIVAAPPLPSRRDQLLDLVRREMLPGPEIGVPAPPRQRYCPILRGLGPHPPQPLGTELRLAPLAAEDSQRLTDHLLRVSDLPEVIRERILARAEGNPLFLEEIIRGLIEEGVLRREGDRWTATVTPEQWTIPTTLRGMIGARIDRLPAAAKALLQHAAVIGRFFAYRTLRALSDEPAELDRALAHLLRAELIREFASPPERQYIFKHALTQEAAEASLLAEQRRDLHGRVARHLESTLGAGAAEQAALLAHHWYHAAEWDKALDHTLAAAARAGELYDRPAASGHYWKALELFDRLPRTEDRQRQHADAAARPWCGYRASRAISRWCS